MDYPQRVPIKVIGHQHSLRADMVREVILAQLGPQPEGDDQHQVQCKGAFLSLTFWITLPHAGAEAPLRAAIQGLPGVVMQL